MIDPRDDSPLLVPRHGAFQRLNHWIVAILFVLLALSGLAMLFPRLFFLTALFGGGEEARQIHPWLGVALFGLFFLLAIPILRNNLWNLDDVRWMARLPDILRNRHEGVPEIGKYNAGQKGVYWMQVLLLPILLASGLVIWEEYFGAGAGIETQRLALLAHGVAALIAITVIVVHAYAAIWISGTLRGMTRGAVTGGWAWRNHRKWFRAFASRMADDGRTE